MKPIHLNILLLAAALVACAAPSSPRAPSTRVDAGARQDPPQAPRDDEDQDEVKKEKVTLGEGDAAEEFELELAADPASRERGLMYRKSLDDHGGMLFVYPEEGYRSFWMKNCLMDLESIFLDEEGKVVATHLMKKEPPKRPRESQAGYEARLKRYPSRRMAQYAIEVKPGTLERLDIKVGDVIELDFERLTKLAKENEQ